MAKCPVLLAIQSCGFDRIEVGVGRVFVEWVSSVLWNCFDLSSWRKLRVMHIYSMWALLNGRWNLMDIELFKEIVGINDSCYE